MPAEGAGGEALYVESSALLRMLLEGDPQLESEMRGFDRFFTSALTLIEVPRALARARRDGRVSDGELEHMLSRHAAFVRACTVAEITRPVRDRAALDFPIEPVRSLDAIHLATVLVWSPAMGETVVASCDERVRRNARALGCEVIPAHAVAEAG